MSSKPKKVDPRFQIEEGLNVFNGNELLVNASLRPALIVLCIDPKRLGWAICNKIKKTVQYQGVPMIVTSQEATDKDFEDHRKLRTRAEEYLHATGGVHGDARKHPEEPA